jgi:hypothetical protein
VTLGLVSHHDLVLYGTVEGLKVVEPKPVAMAPAAAGAAGGAVAGQPYERTVFVSGAPGTIYTVPDSELYSEATIDKPIGEVASNFNDSAGRAGLIPISDIRWTELSGVEKSEMKGEVPSNRLEAVGDAQIHTFIITTKQMVSDVRKDPKCGAFVPNILCYEKGGKTNFFFARPTGKLRQAELNNRVGEGKMMSREAYDEHYAEARDFEKRCDLLLKDLGAKRVEEKPASEPLKE